MSQYFGKACISMKISSKNYIKGIYAKVVIMAMAVHVSYIFIFGSLSMLLPMHYNIFSVIFYVMMLFAVKKGSYRFGVTAVHAEVSLFVLVCTLTGAAGVNMKMYLLAMASIVYFCPYRHKSIPYIFAVDEIILYIFLELFEQFYAPAPAIHGAAVIFLKLYNICIVFGVILGSAFLSDVSASVTRKRLTDENRALSRLANYDQLTGLQSRHLFMKHMEKNSGNTDMTICIGDIDDFKAINDTYGHVYGDYVLQKISEIMKEVLDSDRVDICRWGGEEFLLMFYNIPFQDAYDKTENLRKTISEYNFCFEEKSVHVTMTFGIYNKMGNEEIQSLLNKVDQLLYKGKMKGKNTVVKKVL